MHKRILSSLVIVLFAATAAHAIDKCKVKVDKKTGLIRVDASGLGGPVLWGSASGEESASFFNDATCVADGKAKKCELADPATLAAKTPPPGCTLYLTDGVTPCEAWIPGCTPGSRDHHTLVEFNPVGSPTCTLSGTLFEAGLDLDDDGVLDPGEVTTSQALCAPVDSCATLLAAAPASPDGVYTISPGGVEKEAYCDMTGGGYTYLELGIGQWDQSYPGYTLLSTTDLQDPQVQEFFIWAYNAQGGATAIATWNATDCCLREDPTNVLFFGGNYACPSDGSYYWWNYVQGTSYPMAVGFSYVVYPTLASDFFTTNPVSEGAACSNFGNPGFFARVLAP